MAIAFVTYGRKNTVCKNPFNHLMEFNATEINKAKTIETGTVTKDNAGVPRDQ